MREDDIAQFLEDNPQFFENHLELLQSINLPHPYGGRTVSLSERQLLALREKNKTLESKLRELLDFAKENDELQLKVHQFSCALYAAKDTESMQAAILDLLRNNFAVPHAAIQLWEVTPPSAEVMTFADQTQQPVCSHRPMYGTETWFGESADHLRSFAYLPLRDGENSIGLLILASEDPQRFYPEMGTLFLQRIAETCSSALRPLL